jgi:hypothetical protein
MVSPCEFNGQLRLTYAPESIEHKDLLSHVLPLRQKCAFEFCHLAGSLYKCLHAGNAFEAEVCSILSNVYTEWLSYIRVLQL